MFKYQTEFLMHSLELNVLHGSLDSGDVTEISFWDFMHFSLLLLLISSTDCYMLETEGMIFPVLCTTAHAITTVIHK